MELDRLREFVEAEIAVLLQKDPFWQKCYPCRNNGRCCDQDDPPALPEELEEIELHLASHPNALAQVLENLKSGRRCIFYHPDSLACLVHEARPLVCRLTPFKCHMPDEHSAVVHDGSPNTGCSYFLRRNLEVRGREGRFIHTEKNIYYRVAGLIDPPPSISVFRHFSSRARELGLL